MAEKTLLTKEGYEKIVAEHEELVSVKRKEVAERIKEAISYGDISENAEYDSAKNEQAELEERILKLENMMRNAQIIEHDELNLEFVNVGLHVTIKDLETDEVVEYKIVGSTEADPFEGRISNESAIGKELLGKKVGEVVPIEVPDGSVLQYEVLHIQKK
ncbi:MAG: transcription elongation factor GreA [Clostridiales bacterium]|nr:transcription elongation factor GreA [Clostridiales bacterium]